MQKIIYIDTNIYLDYYKNRKTKYRPLGEIAFNILKRTKKCEFKVIISDIILAELEKYIPKPKIQDLIKWLKNKILFTNITKEQKIQAKTVQIHFPDNLHYTIAKDNNAVIISNDKELIKKGAISSHTL